MSRKKRIFPASALTVRMHWTLAYCPCLLADPEFFRGRLVVVDLETRDVMDKEREWEMSKKQNDRRGPIRCLDRPTDQRRLEISRSCLEG